MNDADDDPALALLTARLALSGWGLPLQLHVFTARDRHGGLDLRQLPLGDPGALPAAAVLDRLADAARAVPLLPGFPVRGIAVQLEARAERGPHLAPREGQAPGPRETRVRVMHAAMSDGSARTVLQEQGSSYLPVMVSAGGSAPPGVFTGATSEIPAAARRLLRAVTAQSLPGRDPW